MATSSLSKAISLPFRRTTSSYRATPGGTWHPGYSKLFVEKLPGTFRRNAEYFRPNIAESWAKPGPTWPVLAVDDPTAGPAVWLLDTTTETHDDDPTALIAALGDALVVIKDHAARHFGTDSTLLSIALPLVGIKTGGFPDSILKY